jgi:Mg2+-importing ATPase
MVVTFAIRTRVSFFRSKPGGWLAAASVAATLVAFVLPATGLGRTYFGFVPLPPGILLLVGGILIGYFAAAESAKKLFFRRFEL